MEVFRILEKPAEEGKLAKRDAEHYVVVTFSKVVSVPSYKRLRRLRNSHRLFV